MGTSTGPRLTGLSIADTNGAIQTHQHLGGAGIVYSKVLASADHLGPPWSRIEYVSLPHCRGGVENSVGERVQETDEIILLVEGTGVLTINGTSNQVTPCNLIIASRGTKHTIRNPSCNEQLSFLVVGLLATETGQPPSSARIDLAHLLVPQDIIPQVRVGTHPVRPLVATIDLKEHLSSAWGKLSFIILPPGGRSDEYVENTHDQVLFTLSGSAVIYVADICFESTKDHLSVIVPPGVYRRFVNRSGIEPLSVLCLNVDRHNKTCV